MPPIGSSGGLQARSPQRAPRKCRHLDRLTLPPPIEQAGRGSDVPQTPYRLHIERLGFDDLPGWTFSVEERSAGMDVVRGADEARRAAEMVGEDSEDLLRRCHADAVTRRA